MLLRGRDCSLEHTSAWPNARAHVGAAELRNCRNLVTFAYKRERTPQPAGFILHLISKINTDHQEDICQHKNKI